MVIVAIENKRMRAGNVYLRVFYSLVDYLSSHPFVKLRYRTIHGQSPADSVALPTFESRPTVRLHGRRHSISCLEAF